MAVYVPSEDTLYVDNTTLTTFKACKTRAIVRHCWNVAPKDYTNVPMQAGTSLHKGIEVYYIQQDKQAAIDAFVADYYDYAVAKIEPDDRYHVNNLALTLEAWAERMQPHMLPYIINPELIEIPFEVLLHPADPSIRFVGRIDAIVESKLEPDTSDRKPNRMILDNKSTGKARGAFVKQFVMSSQLTGYIYAAQQLFGQDYDINRAYINMISTQKIPTDKRKCRIHKIPMYECGWLHPPHDVLGPFMRSPGQIEEWRKDAYALATAWRDYVRSQLQDRDISRVPMDGQFQYDECNRCELLDYCRSGRPKEYAWEPQEWLPGDLSENPPANRYIWEGETLCITDA